jgi:methionyl-tRNA formyltransferase
MLKIALFTADLIGIKIINFLNNQKNVKLFIFVSKDNIKIINSIRNKKNIRIYEYYENLKNQKKRKIFIKTKFDFLISAYFNKIFQKDIITSVKKTINFHPSYLPFNRGCYPHVHSMLSGKGCGITLHEINNRIDGGKIWFQKKVKLKIYDDQTSFHNRLKKELISQFIKIWPLIINNKIKPKSQNIRFGNYNDKNSLKKYDKLLLNKKYKLKDLIKILKARSYGKTSFAYFTYQKKDYKIKINIMKSK